MHRCLQVPEIFHAICKQIYDPKQLEAIFQRHRQSSLITVDGELAVPWRSLFSLAQTCKAFSEVSLNLLWYYQPHLHHLLSCLPVEVVERRDIERAGGKRQKLLLKRDIRREDLKRIMFYGGKIRVLGCPTLDGIAVMEEQVHWQDPLMTPALMNAVGEGLLLPNLIQYNAHLSHFDGLCWEARLVACPSAKSIYLVAHRDDLEEETLQYSWENIKSIVARSSEGLTSFRISLPGYNTMNELDIYDMGSAPHLMSLLQSLKIPEVLEVANVPIDLPTLLALSSAETLRHLHFTLPSSVAHDWSQISMATPGVDSFKSLQNLLIHVHDFRACCSFLETVQSGHVSSLKIVCSHSSHEFWDIDYLLKNIAKLPFTQTLLGIEVQTAIYKAKPSSTVTTITRETLQLIHGLKKLKKIRISLNGRVCIDRATLDDIVSTWPRLEVLDLSERTLESEFLPSITLRDFLALSSALPDLLELRLRVNAKMDVLYAHYGASSGSSNLRIADFCTSPASNSTNIASELMLCLPKLKEIVYGWRYEDEAGDSLDHDAPGIEWEFLDVWETVESMFGKLFHHRTM